MADSIIPKKDLFPKVREAREALKAKALEMAEKYEKAVTDALAAGEYKVAIEAMQWFILHAPNHEGVTIVDSSLDIPKPVEKGSKGPRIQIGIKLGEQSRVPFNSPQLVPAEVTNQLEILDITPDDSDPTKPKS